LPFLEFAPGFALVFGRDCERESGRDCELECEQGFAPEFGRDCELEKRLGYEPREETSPECGFGQQIQPQME
jgi:hypothetical protein